MKVSKHLQSDRQRVDDRTKFIAAEHLERFGIGGRKILPRRHCGQHLRHRLLLELRRDRLKHHHRGIARIPQIAGRRIRNPRRLIVAGEIIAELNLPRHHADHGEAHAGDLHRLAHRRASAEQLFLESATQEDHAPSFQFVFGINPAAFRRDFVAHLAIFRTDSAHRRGPHHAVAVGNSRTPDGLKAHMLHQRSGRPSPCRDRPARGRLSCRRADRPAARWSAAASR